MDLEKDGQKCVVRSTGESVSELLNYIEKNHVDLIENHLIIDFSEKASIEEASKAKLAILKIRFLKIFILKCFN